MLQKECDWVILSGFDLGLRSTAESQPRALLEHGCHTDFSTIVRDLFVSHDKV